MRHALKDNVKLPIYKSKYLFLNSYNNQIWPGEKCPGLVKIEENMSSENNAESQWSSVHVCVLSSSAIAPVLSPLLDRQLGCKSVVVIATRDNAERFEFLKEVLNNHQIDAQLKVISSVFDIETLRQELSELLVSLVDERPLVNVTVGSKPLSIVLHEQAVVLDFPVYYLNTNDQLSWFWPKHQPMIELEDRIKCAQFLRAHGLSVESAESPQMRPGLVDVFSDLLSDFAQRSELILILNRLANRAGKHYQAVLTKAELANAELRAFLQRLDEHGCIRFKRDEVDFINEQRHFFANGGWLEYWVHVHLNRLKQKLPALQHHLASVELQCRATGVKNEIDNLLLYNNNLYLVECKTVRFKAGAKPAVDVIYKLDTLQKQLGGVLGKGLLVSFYPITERELERARLYGIEVIHGEQLARLEDYLMRWLIKKR